MLADLKNTLSLGFSSKFATRFMSYFLPQLKRVATVPCEIQKLNNSSALDVFNTLS